MFEYPWVLLNPLLEFKIIGFFWCYDLFEGNLKACPLWSNNWNLDPLIGTYHHSTIPSSQHSYSWKIGMIQCTIAFTLYAYIVYHLEQLFLKSITPFARSVKKWHRRRCLFFLNREGSREPATQSYWSKIITKTEEVKKNYKRKIAGKSRSHPQSNKISPVG